jgi:phage-related protein
MVKPEFDWGEEFETFLTSLSTKEEAKFRALIDPVENTDLQDSIRKERVKKLDDDIYELRAQTNDHWLRGCYFQIQGTEYYITHGFSKKTNATSVREISRAKKIRKLLWSAGSKRRDEK